MYSEVDDKYVGMMPDEFDAETWREDILEIVERFSKQSGILPDENQGVFELVRTWKKGEKTQQLIVENKRIKREGEDLFEERTTVWTLSGTSFTDLKKGDPIPQDAKVWGACLPFSPDDARRGEILTMVETNLTNL